MWKPLLRCGIVGGIVVFLWMMVSWMVLPLHEATMNRFADQEEVTSSLIKYAPNDGIYVVPTYDANSEALKGHPFIFVNIARGVDYNMTKPIFYSVVVQIIAAMLITYLLLKTKAMKYWSRVWFVTWIGVIVGLLGIFPSWNWWHFSTNWVVIESLDIIVGWFLGGLVIAKLVKN